MDQETEIEFPAGVEPIYRELGQHSLAEVFDMHKERPQAVYRGLAGISTCAPGEFIELFGRSEHSHKVLMDQCMGFKHTVCLHEHFGPVSALQFVMKSSTLDDEVFDKAQNMGFSAIFTYDGHEQDAVNLTTVAKNSYLSSSENQKNLPPHLVILPKNNAQEKMKTKKDQINEYLSAPASNVFFLR